MKKKTAAYGFILTGFAMTMLFVPVVSASNNTYYHGSVTTYNTTCLEGPWMTISWTIVNTVGLSGDYYTSSWSTSGNWPSTCTTVGSDGNIACFGILVYETISSPNSGGTGKSSTPPNYHVGPVIFVAQYKGGCGTWPWSASSWNPTLYMSVQASIHI
jgi:hypothetical protein